MVSQIEDHVNYVQRDWEILNCKLEPNITKCTRIN
jgi:hypothetical protein